MSVLINGIEMPKSCLECMTSGLRTAIACAEWTEISAGERENYRSLSCPLVEVPEKHGRLIDADVLIEEAQVDGAYGYVNIKQIHDAPTVIEAEGE